MSGRSAAGPTPVPAIAPPAGPWRRFMCIAYEGVLLFGVVFITAYAFSALAQFRGEPGAARTAFQAFMAAVLALYFGWFWSRGRRTLPMKTLGVRVVDRSGVPLSPARALARFACAAAMAVAVLAAAALVSPWLAALALVPPGWSLADRERRALYDVACGTRLVVSRD